MGQRTPIGSKTILIVEDEALVRFDLVDFFEDAGWRVFDVRDADEAIAILDENHEIRAVLIDAQLPGSMDGLKLAHHVRRRLPPTIMFVVSGNDPVRAEQLPERTAFLAKPFDHHRLLHELEAATHQ